MMEIMNETINLVIETDTLLRILGLGVIAFVLSMALTPVYTTFAFKYEWWKKPRTKTVTGTVATMFTKLHAKKHERHIPTMAGMIFLASVTVVTLLLNLSRDQTWLPLAAFVGAGIIGLIDDFVNVKGPDFGVAGLSSKLKLLMTTGVALVGGLYFFTKLDVTSVSLPGGGAWALGWLIVPLFVLVVVATANAVNITDGLDGLAGGLTAIAFGAYAVIAFIEARYGVAGFCLSIVGALLAYTWFNVYPARFFMGDVGATSLGVALGVVAMITDTVWLLPIIGVVFVAETGSVILQVTSKKLRHGKKIFKISPLHHHFEAIGWPETKVTMRFWILGQVAGVMGIALFVLGRYL
jgi:phospho-N-acetylmuramoyl-pentapeptide-transferase